MTLYKNAVFVQSCKAQNNLYAEEHVFVDQATFWVDRLYTQRTELKFYSIVHVASFLV